MLSIQKVRANLAANPQNAKTLESLLAHDKASNPNAKNRTATDGLMWLLRGLKFTALGLRNNTTNKDEELSASFTKGYEGSLKKYHGMMVRPLFYVRSDALVEVNKLTSCSCAYIHPRIVLLGTTVVNVFTVTAPRALLNWSRLIILLAPSTRQLAMKACPYRATFYPKLGQPTDVVLVKLEEWLSALEAIVKKEEGVFKNGGYGEI
jgi:hypothetical protein